MPPSWSARVAVDRQDRHTIRLRGDLDLTCRDAIRELIDAAVETGAVSLRFDMRHVTLCGSDCVGVLVHALRTELPVSVAPSAQVLRTIEMTGLDRIGGNPLMVEP